MQEGLARMEKERTKEKLRNKERETYINISNRLFTHYIFMRLLYYIIITQ